MAKNTLNLHFEDFSLFDDLTDEEVGKITRGLMEYAMTGQEPEFEDRLIRSVFRHLINHHDKDVQAYKDKCDRNRENVQKRWDTTVYDRTVSNTNDTDKIRLDKIRLDKDKKKESKKKEKPVHHKHGEFQHVLLTDEELKRLQDEFGIHETDAAIKKVDEYCEQHGKTYKNYNLVLRNWGYDKKPRSDVPESILSTVWG